MAADPSVGAAAPTVLPAILPPPSAEQVVDTSVGPGRLVTFDPSTFAAQGHVRSEVLLSHGAGGGIEARDLAVLAATLPALGHRVHLLEQPWRVAGRKIATAPSTLDVALSAARALVQAAGEGRPLVLGGRSAGARSACRCAAQDPRGLLGVLALSFPLHPPKRPEKSRAAELAQVPVPAVVVQGERDAMGRPEEFVDGTELLVVPAADHALSVGARAVPGQAACLDLIAVGVGSWLDRLLR